MNKPHGPWTIKNSLLKYKNAWMEVHEDEVLQPDGKPGIYGTVRINPGVSILPMDAEGNVYLVEEFQYALGTQSIEVASGGMEKGETPLVCAKRELKEELGITAHTWIPLGWGNPHSVVNSPNYMFFAQDLTFTTPRLDSTETLKSLKVLLPEAVRMVMDGRIISAQTCTLILKVQEYLKNHI